MPPTYEQYSLKGMDIAVLRAIGEACEYTLAKHVSEHIIIRNCDTNIRSRDIKKSIKKLHNKSLIIKHPTGGEMTYQLSKDGQTLALTL